MIFPEYTYLLPSPYPEFFQIYQANSSESSILMPPSSRNSSPPAVEGEVKVNQSCITLCNPMDYSPILQARILGWVAIPFSRGSSQPNPGIEPRSPAWQADSLPAEPPGKPGSFQPSYFLLNISPQRSSLIALSTVKVKSEVAQLCPTLCDPVDCSPPGSSLHGILQARILEWVAISFSRGSS